MLLATVCMACGGMLQAYIIILMTKNSKKEIHLHFGNILVAYYMHVVVVVLVVVVLLVVVCFYVCCCLLLGALLISILALMPLHKHLCCSCLVVAGACQFVACLLCQALFKFCHCKKACHQKRLRVYVCALHNVSAAAADMLTCVCIMHVCVTAAVSAMIRFRCCCYWQLPWLLQNHRLCY